ncbi:type II secretion system protein [Fictibacillus sp. 5RED26]|jgi:type IV pilus assembly protein PilA|uniref:type II secretion system protein n=1 Tax=Fictibacillus sp. 5RED26 TaxID=2745876 RepID=UPI0018CDD2CC|nr:type II secretion system protein [Fictibacillus sp. 5RED26]MBH0156859.1 type II secretion system protein [Fictibacillus sp. 5RED26]
MLKNFKRLLKNEKGLTLIELLVVIVILGIIAAIAVVSIGGIIGKTKEKAQVTEAVQIINGAKLAYAADNKASSWENSSSLSDYVNNLKDSEWKVTLASGAYSIDGHAAEAVSGVDTNTDGVLSETELTKYLGGQ